MDQIKVFQTSKPLKRGTKAPEKFTVVLVNMCFYVKFDLRRKVRPVSGGNITIYTYKETYYGVDNIKMSGLISSLDISTPQGCLQQMLGIAIYTAPPMIISTPFQDLLNIAHKLL